MNYFYRDQQNREIGPLPLSALTQLRQAGLLTDDTQVRSETGTTWNEFRSVISAIAPPAPSAPGVTTPTSQPGTNRTTRAKRYSWSFYALAALCFLLPFIGVSRQPQNYVLSGLLLATGGGFEATNSVTGKLELNSISAEPIISLALGLTLTALILALTRKPFLSLLSGLSGIGGIAALLYLQSIVEKVIAAKNVELNMREGFWLACALLTGGVVIQFVLLSEARKNEGWKLNRRHYLTFACLAFAATIFCFGPAIYDTEVNTAPTKQELLSSMFLQRPQALASFTLVTVDCKYNQTGDKASGKANLTLALLVPFYVADDFAKRAQEKGDDPQAFATALERRNQLPSNLAPKVPANLSRPLFSIAKPVGYQFTIEVDISANKLPRGWSFDDCVWAWSNRRAWDIQRITNWPALPTEFSGLLTFEDLVMRGGIFFEDESTDRLLDAYIDGRAAFIKAVSSAEAIQARQVFEKSLSDAARAEITKDFFPASAYTVQTITVNLPGEMPAAGATKVVDVDVVIEQTDYLLRLAQEQAKQWEEFQPGSAFEKAKTLAGSISAKAVPPKPLDPMVYELASSPHSTSTKLQIEIKGPANASVVQRVTWPDSATFANKSLVAFKETNGNALLASAQSAAPNFPTMQDYRNQMQTFIQAVWIEQELQNLQKSTGYFVKENPNDPKFDKFSYQDDSFFDIYNQQFTNSYISVWTAISKVLSNNSVPFLSYDFKFGEISTKYVQFDRGFFNPPGEKRLRILLTNSEKGVKVEVKTYICINWINWSKAQIDKAYSGLAMKNPQFHGYGNVYLEVPEYRNYNNEIWTMYPDTDESKRLSLEFLDQLSTELKKAP